MSDPLLWLTGAIAALAGFTAWLVRWVLAHLESDLTHARKVGTRGTELAERGADLAEERQ